MKHLSGSGFDKVELLYAPQPRTSHGSVLQSPVQPALSGIPPERVGLNGEYDHCGLAKRVALSLRGHLSHETIASIKIAQRGQVVIFSGRSIPLPVVEQLEAIALSVEGATFVEIYGVDSAVQQVA